MEKVNTMALLLSSARLDADSACGKLQSALNRATAVEAIVILLLIERAAMLQRDINALAEAVRSGAK